MTIRERTLRLGSLFLLALIPSCKEDAPPVTSDPALYTTETPESDSDVEPVALYPLFVDITTEAGISFVHENGAVGDKWMPETVGAGGGFIDYDHDGDADILLINSGHWPGSKTGNVQTTPKLYRNDGAGKYDDVTVETGLDAIHFYGMGLTGADYDGDGDCDLFLTGLGRNYLLRNDSGRFKDVTSTLLAREPNGDSPNEISDWSTGAAWFDYDLDGDLDLFVCNYVSWSPETDVHTTLDGTHKSYSLPQVYDGRTNRLYENRGDGQLVEVTTSAGVRKETGKSLGVLVGDLNGDHRPDLFVTNDTEPNFLFMNRDSGKFEEIGLFAGCGYDESGRARAGMGVDVADLTNDGSLCIGIGNFSNEPVSLYQRLGDQELYIDAAGKARISRPTLLSLTFGLIFADFDSDGWIDLMLANGHVEPQINSVQQRVTFAQSPQLFRNSQSGRFDEISDRVGADFATPIVGRTLAYADIDADGDLDVLLTANGGRPRLLRNDLPMGHQAIRLRLRGAGHNPDAIGAMVTATAGTLRQTRSIQTGRSYLSQSEFTVSLGLDRATEVDVDVRWPSGRVEKLGVLPAGYTHVIIEGQGISQTDPFSNR